MIDDLNYILLYYTTYWLAQYVNNLGVLVISTPWNSTRYVSTHNPLCQTLYWMFKSQ